MNTYIQQIKSGVFGLPATGYVLPDGKEVWYGVDFFGDRLHKSFGSKAECISAMVASVERQYANLHAIEQAEADIRIRTKKNDAEKREATEKYFARLRQMDRQFFQQIVLDQENYFRQLLLDIKSWIDSVRQMQKLLSDDLEQWAYDVNEIPEQDSPVIVLATREEDNAYIYQELDFRSGRWLAFFQPDGGEKEPVVASNAKGATVLLRNRPVAYRPAP